MNADGLLGQLFGNRAHLSRRMWWGLSPQPLRPVYPFADGVWTGFGSQTRKMLENESLKTEAGARGC